MSPLLFLFQRLYPFAPALPPTKVRNPITNTPLPHKQPQHPGSPNPRRPNSPSPNATRDLQRHARRQTGRQRPHRSLPARRRHAGTRCGASVSRAAADRGPELRIQCAGGAGELRYGLSFGVWWCWCWALSAVAGWRRVSEESMWESFFSVCIRLWVERRDIGAFGSG